MSAAQQLQQLASEAQKLRQDYANYEEQWNAWIAAADDAEERGSASDMRAALAALERVGPTMQGVLARIEEIETLSDEVFEAAQAEFEQTIQPARDAISSVYSDVPMYDETWSDDLDSYRETITELEHGAPEQLSRRARPAFQFRVG